MINDKSEFFDIPLKSLYPNVIAIANRVMNLNGEREKALPIALEILAHSEHRQQEFDPVKNLVSLLFYVAVICCAGLQSVLHGTKAYTVFSCF